MKKRFALTDIKKSPERVLEGIKSEIKKYIRREKNKPLPKDADFWKIDCRFAKNDEELQEIRFEDVKKCINEASEESCESFMIELLAKSANFIPKAVEEVEGILEEDIIENKVEELEDIPDTE